MLGGHLTPPLPPLLAARILSLHMKWLLYSESLSSPSFPTSSTVHPVQMVRSQPRKVGFIKEPFAQLWPEKFRNFFFGVQSEKRANSGDQRKWRSQNWWEQADKSNQGSKDPDKGVKGDHYEQEILACHSVSMGKPRVQS